MGVISKFQASKLQSSLFWAHVLHNVLSGIHLHKKSFALIALVLLFFTQKLRIRWFINWLNKRNRAWKVAKERDVSENFQLPSRGSEVKKVDVNKEFFVQFVKIFKILVPSLRSKVLWILILHTFFLVLRTYISLYIATLDGKLVKYLVGLENRQSESP
jgi:hypothetical protein